MANLSNQYQKIIKDLDYSWRVYDPKRIESLRQVLVWLNQPDSNFKAIHIVGTNGKGSVGTMISSILTKQGYKVGHFSSPFVVSDLEQITVNQTKISQKDFISSYEKILDVLKDHQQTADFLSYFEWMTIIAFDYFSSRRVDFAVIEAGVGGADDATNILLHPQVVVLTKIALDHTDLLGKTITDIAKNKAQVIKENSTVVIDPQQTKNAVEVIQKIALEKNAVIADNQFPELKLVKSSPEAIQISVNNLVFDLPLFGNYQRENLRLALITIKHLALLNDFEITDKTLIKAIREVNIENREFFDSQNRILYTGAHNLDGIKALVETVDSWNLKTKPNLILGILKDKNYKQMIRKIVPIANVIICVTPSYQNINQDRVLTAGQLADEILKIFPDQPVSIVEDNSSIKKLINNKKQAITIATGSIYTLRKLLKGDA